MCHCHVGCLHPDDVHTGQHAFWQVRPVSAGLPGNGVLQLPHGCREGEGGVLMPLNWIGLLMGKFGGAMTCSCFGLHSELMEDFESSPLFMYLYIPECPDLDVLGRSQPLEGRGLLMFAGHMGL